MTTAVMGLFAMMLIVMLMRVAIPLGVRIDGRRIAEFRLGFPERLRVQRTNVYFIGAALLLGSIAGWLPTVLEIAVIVGVFAILAIPQRYTFTDQGIAFNHVVFRRWSEFAEVGIRRDQMVLEGRPGSRNFSMLVGPAPRGEALRLATKAIARAASQGSPRKEVRPATPPTTTTARS